MTRKTYRGGKKGRCNVGADKHRLRISIPAKFFGGKRVFLYCNMDDTVDNVVEAQKVADAMNADIAARCFDLSLGRYERMVSTDQIVIQNQENFDGSIPGVHEQKLTIVWRRWVHQLRLPEETYNNKYRWVERYIHAHDPDWNNPGWTDEIVTGPDTFNSYISYVRRCIEWALNEGLIRGKNPYRDLRRKAPPPSNEVKGFSMAEKKRILDCFYRSFLVDFGANSHRGYYYPMVATWFETGMRTGEVIGLKWDDVDFAAGKITVRRSQSPDHTTAGKGHRKVEKKTKTQTTRKLPITPPILKYLMMRKTMDTKGKALVFPSPKGTVINTNNWSKRVWRPTLEACGVPYQRPYNIRHTLLSEAARDPEIGVVGAAQIAGHSNTKTVQERYIGYLEEPRLPSSDRLA
ncbi:MAG: tyrosine-type recombinase/integrase [Cyanobacteria bacterium P01_D01_bin.73]